MENNVTVDKADLVTADNLREWPEERVRQAAIGLLAGWQKLHTENEKMRGTIGKLGTTLIRFRDAFGNRGETTSLQSWNQRMKEVDEEARLLLVPEAS